MSIIKRLHDFESSVSPNLSRTVNGTRIKMLPKRNMQNLAHVWKETICSLLGLGPGPDLYRLLNNIQPIAPVLNLGLDLEGRIEA
jgi:hypothetical protein